jgi:hypothetical protein
MRFVLLHYHIYKNAGMSVQEFLDRNFGERFCRLDTRDPNGRVDNTGLLAFLNGNDRLQAVSSHQIRYPVPAVPGLLFFDLVFLRDPLDRVRSMYDYARAKPVEGDPVSDLASRFDLGGFVEHLLSRMPQWVCDAQVDHLAGGAGRNELERATRTILQSSLPGVVDCLEQSLAAGKFFLRPVFPGLRCAAPAVNVSRGLEGTVIERNRRLREACGNRLYAELEARNSLDLELVKRARAEVERRFSLASR